MPKVNFTDNLALLNNPDRGQIMESRFLTSVVSQHYWESWDNTYGNLEKIWFDHPIYIHEVGRTIKWYHNGVLAGQGVIRGWDHEFNIIISGNEGEYAEAGDTIENYDINTFNYVSEFVTWKELEPTEGFFDWDFVDSKIGKDFCIANQKQIIFGFCMDYPTLVDHRDIPDWLYSAINGDGAAYQFEEVGNTKKGWSPNYANPIIISRHKIAIDAIKAHYGNLIHSVEIGSVGHWGELHTYPQLTGLGSMPNNAVMAQYFQHYLDNWDHTQLSIRRPIDKGTDSGFALYFQMLGGPDHLYEPWGLMNLAQNGYTDEYGFAQKAYPNFRAMGPVGGEHDPYVDEATWEYDFSNEPTGRNYARTVQMAMDLELSRVRSHPQVHLGRIDGIPVKANVEDFTRRLGYRFVLREFEYTINGANLDITVKIENKGFARCYKNYPVYICFYNAANVLVKRVNMGVNLKTILRGTTGTFTKSIQYPTCDKIAFQIEQVKMPINALPIGDNAYLMFSNHLEGVMADVPIATMKVNKGDGVIVPISIYSLTSNFVSSKALRVRLAGEVGVLDTVDVAHPDASPIRIKMPDAVKAIKR